MCDDNWNHVENWTPDNFRDVRRGAVRHISLRKVKRDNAQRHTEGLIPPAPSRLRRLLLPTEKQIAAAERFVSWVDTPIITSQGQIVPELVKRFETLLEGPAGEDDWHPLHANRRNDTIDYMVNFVLKVADDVILRGFQSLRDVDVMLISFLDKWGRSVQSSPLKTDMTDEAANEERHITNSETVRKRRKAAAKDFEFIRECTKIIQSRAHAILLFNQGPFAIGDEEHVKALAATESYTIREAAFSVYDQLDINKLRSKLCPTLRPGPLYGFLELFPACATSEHELPDQQASLKQKQADARAEIVERTRPADHRPDKNLYPICDTFMSNAVDHTKSSFANRRGPYGLCNDDLERPTSDSYLLQLRIPGARCQPDNPGAFCLAVGYFTGIREIRISGGQNELLKWPSNKILVFFGQITLPSDSYMWIHVQSFKQ